MPTTPGTFTWPAPLDTSITTVEPWSAWAFPTGSWAKTWPLGTWLLALGTTVTLKPSASRAARATSTGLPVTSGTVRCWVELRSSRVARNSRPPASTTSTPSRTHRKVALRFLAGGVLAAA